MRFLTGLPRFLILIFVVLAVLMVFSAVFELHQSRLELLSLMEEQAHSVLESLIISAGNSIEFNEELISSHRRRLLNNARLVKILYEKDKLDPSILSDICRRNKILRINIFNNKGKKVLSSHISEHSGLVQRNDPRRTLMPIFSGETDSLVIGIKRARYHEGYRYAVAVAAENRSAIVVNMDAADLLRIRKKTGFGVLLRNLIQSPNIIYAALQDTSAIIAASGNISSLEKIQASGFLSASLYDSVFASRTTIFDSTEVLEAVHPLSLKGNVIGLFRLGLSLEPLQDINNRIYRRLIIITIVLILVGFLLFTFIFIRQRYEILQKQYHEVETYSGGILNGVGDSIIVCDTDFRIKIFNPAAEKLFKMKQPEVIGHDLKHLLSNYGCENVLETPSGMEQVECFIDNMPHYLLVSKSTIGHAENGYTTIIVLRDITEQHRMEIQMERLNRMTAMGELASGVAHEIRNPLNTISTIIQQIKKDFSPAVNEEEYHQLVELVSKDIKRIDQTIGDFLRFARPEPINPRPLELEEFLNNLAIQYQAMVESSGSSIEIVIDQNEKICWDEEQMRQVFMNLIKNALDALKEKGTIKIDAKNSGGDYIEIAVSDDGQGMQDDVQEKIFNLYFTTKASGTGIGLSMVQRIIYEHGGSITVNSQLNKGTVFNIRMPRDASREITGKKPNPEG